MEIEGEDGTTAGATSPDGSPRSRFSGELMHAAATLYYLKEATQADVARQLGLSRATVSRVLSEARRSGIVRIEVVDPTTSGTTDLEQRLAAAMGLSAVLLAPRAHPSLTGSSLASPLGRALENADLRADDVVLVSSGRTVWEIGQEKLPSFPGIIVAPTVGGQNEPEAWYQTNEISRMFAERTSGRPVFLYAPAQPGPGLHDRLLDDPGTRRVLDLWERAKVAVLGVGAPPLTRESMPDFVPRDAPWLGTASGDICTRFFDGEGQPLDYPGVGQLIATSYDVLRAVPHTIAVAVGESKVPGLLAAARAGWFNTLVTDDETALHLLARCGAEGR